MRHPALIGAAAALLLACGGESSPPPADGGAVDAGTADVRPAADAEPSAGDDGGADAAAVDASPDAHMAPDAAPPDADLGCEACRPSSPCMDAVCVLGACQEVPVEDGTGCAGDGASLCVAGACVERGCGDGFREPGPEPVREGCDDGNQVDGDACSTTCVPTVVAVAARTGGVDLPAGAPRVAGSADGRGEVLAVWHAREGVRAYAVMARRYSRTGAPQGAAFVVASGYADGATLQPTVVGLASGWVVAWTSYGAASDGDGTGIALAPVSATGAVGQPISANATTFGDQRDPVLAPSPDGGVLVAWTDTLGASASTRVLVRRYSAALAPVSGDVVVGGGDRADHFEPTIAAGQHSYAVAWTRRVLGAEAQVLLRRFSPGGTVLDAEPIVVSELAEDGHAFGGSEASLVARRDGAFVVAWTTFRDDLRGDVRARVIPALAPPGAEPSFPIAARANAVERLPSLASVGDGVACVIHRSSSQSGLLRDLEVVYSGTLPPPELAALQSRLSTSAQQFAGSLAAAPGALWVLWGEDTFLPTQSPATLAFVLPEAP